MNTINTLTIGDIKEKLSKAFEGGDFEVMMTLIGKGADMEELNPEIIALATAAKGRLDVINFLESEDIRKKRVDALVRASYNGKLEVVRFLVELGANPAEEYYYPLHLAVKAGHLEIVKYFFRNCFNFKKVPMKIKYLKCAIENENLEMLSYLLRQGIDIGEYQSVIQWAASSNRLDIIKIFSEAYEFGALGNLMMSIAAHNNNISIVEYLDEQGYDMSSTYKFMMYESIEKGYLGILKFLGKKGVTAKGDDYALSLAEKRSNAEIIRYVVGQEVM